MGAIRHHLFYAVLPTHEQRARIALRSLFLDGATSIVGDTRLHMTMGITPLYADYPEALADQMCGWASRVANDPVPLTLDLVTGWARPDERGAVCLRPARRPRALAALSRELCAPLIRHGALREDWAFNPHVTLLYWRGDSFEHAIDAVAWQAAEFVLIHSMVGANRHRLLGRWPLVSRQGAFAFG